VASLYHPTDRDVEPPPIGESHKYRALARSSQREAGATSAKIDGRAP
jgi:hypothetical protein